MVKEVLAVILADEEAAGLPSNVTRPCAISAWTRARLKSVVSASPLSRRPSLDITPETTLSVRPELVEGLLLLFANADI